MPSQHLTARPGGEPRFPWGRLLRLLAGSPRGRLIVLLAAGLVACRNPDVVSSSHDSMGDAVASGIVRQGWVPDWLPEHARQIREIHDLDTNEWAVSFAYASERGLAVPDGCMQTKGLETLAPRLGAEWWPEDVPASVLNMPRHEYFQCAGYVLAKADSRGEGFVWSSRAGE